MYGKIRVSDTSKRPGTYSTFIVFDDGTESPIFADLAGLYPWMRANGVVMDESMDECEACFCPWRVRKS